MSRRTLSAVLLATVLIFGGPGFAGETGFLKADNGLAPVAAASLGLYLGELAVRQPESWQGFPKGGGGSDDSGAGQPTDCAADSIAKALKGVKVQDMLAPDGLIRTDRLADGTQRPTYDANALYEPGQPVTCQQP